MATSTIHRGYAKPDLDDFYDIGQFNDNMDKIDEDIHMLMENKLEISQISEITADELAGWYSVLGDDAGIPNEEILQMYQEDVAFDEDTGITNEEIDRMYSEDIDYGEDTGITREEIDAMYE